MYTYLVRENKDPLALPSSHTNEEQRAATVPLEGDLSLIHISEPRDRTRSRMPSSA